MTDTGVTVRVDKLRRHLKAMQKARSIGFDRIGDAARFSNAAEITFQSAQSVMASTARTDRRRMRKRRRELIDAALVANGATDRVRSLVRLGRWFAWLLPVPFNVIVPAVLWMVDEMIDAVEKASPFASP